MRLIDADALQIPIIKDSEDDMAVRYAIMQASTIEGTPTGYVFRWIPVEEALPGTDEVVFVTEQIRGEFKIGTNIYSQEHHDWIVKANGEIVAWMPLKPYRHEENLK